MVGKGCLSYFDYVHDTGVYSLPPLDPVWLIEEFMDVFPIELPSMHLDRDMNLAISFDLGTRSISVSPYRVALEELK